MSQEIKSHVLSIIKDIELGMKYEQCPDCGCTDFDEHDDCKDCGNHMTIHGFDYISDVLDIQFIVNNKKEYLGARLLVAFGGPNIWIDTHKKCVEGGWWSDAYTASYSKDTLGLDEACKEYFNCC